MQSDDISELIAEGISPLTGGEDLALHTGIVQTWNELTNENTVSINGAVLTNLKLLSNGIGARFYVGDVVQVLRRQTQYFVLGKVAAASGLSTSSAPGYSAKAGGTISGTTGVWKDLDAGTSVSPSVTMRVGGSALVTWGIADLQTNNSMVECGITISGATTFPPGWTLGTSFFSGRSNGSNGGPLTESAPSRQFMFLQNYGFQPYYFRKGLQTFTLKYKLNTYFNGTGADVYQPWISVQAF